MRDSGNHSTAALDHGGIGEGSHSPGGLYNDEVLFYIEREREREREREGRRGCNGT